MLFFTEMIPKTLGRSYWKKLAPFTAYAIKFLIAMTYPFVLSFEYIADCSLVEKPRIKLPKKKSN